MPLPPPPPAPAMAGVARQLYAEGLPVGEIARRTGLSRSQVYYWADRLVGADGRVTHAPLPRRGGVVRQPAGKAGAGEPEAGKSGSGGSGSDRSGVEKADDRKAGAGVSRNGKPGDGQSGTGKLRGGKAGARKSGTGEAGAGEAGTGESGAGKPGDSKSGDGKSRIGKSRIGKSRVGMSGAGKVAGSRSGAGKSPSATAVQDRRRPASGAGAEGRSDRSIAPTGSPDRPPIAPARRRGSPRARLLARLWQAAERQVAEIEARIAAAGLEAGSGEPRAAADTEKDARALALLARTLRELSAAEGEGSDPLKAKAASAHDPVRDLDVFRRELARRLDRLREGGPGAGPAG